MTKVFIDGSSGTTGLRIRERLAARGDLTLLEIPYGLRRDETAKREALNAVDIVFLCLPDEAALADAALVQNPNTAVIDTSTAHRTADGWVYGFPELGEQRAAIKNAKRIANPGCHASGFLALVAPLVRAGLLPADAALCCFSLTGYSGGGKKMIEHYESGGAGLRAPRQYGLSQQHKHLKEMTAVAGLSSPPVFCPVVDDYYSGMQTVVPLFARDLRGTAQDIKELYKSIYGGPVVRYAPSPDTDGFLASDGFAGRDDMEVAVNGNDARIVLTARFDNLGKGASGAAVQNMNLLMGVEETTGLVLGGTEE